jgi:hypothetical protein
VRNSQDRDENDYINLFHAVIYTSFGSRRSEGTRWRKPGDCVGKGGMMKARGINDAMHQAK